MLKFGVFSKDMLSPCEGGLLVACGTPSELDADADVPVMCCTVDATSREGVVGMLVDMTDWPCDGVTLRFCGLIAEVLC